MPLFPMDCMRSERSRTVLPFLQNNIFFGFGVQISWKKISVPLVGDKDIVIFLTYACILQQFMCAIS